jgi:hypothetical protein
MPTIARLRGDRCRCPTCHEPFNSTRAFDKHRVGNFPDGRRCLTVAEMAAHGMAVNAAGFWITKPREHRPRNISPARRSGDRLEIMHGGVAP